MESGYMDIDLEKVGFIIAKAREFEAPEGMYDPGDDPQSLAEQEGYDEPREELHTVSVGGTAYDEAKSRIDDMNVDEQCELVALAWIGRGDFSKEDWNEALNTARQEHNNRTAEYLLGMPHLPDHLQAALDEFDLSVTP